MYSVTKRMEVSSAHKLDLDYDSKCKNIHGHNWIIEVEVSAKELNKNGMVVDFSVISDIVKKLDHVYLNDRFSETNTTAENMAKWIADSITQHLEETADVAFPMNDKIFYAEVTKVTVQESKGNTACYIP